ncbi:MAG: hypothetical protein QCI82_00930 [Candidatus Thermoplasmatota archaeon]|nr:hypothetical protein [Candidatus Thermoplasmatota archaeon]
METDNENVMDWLLNSDPWIEYRTRIDLLEEPQDSKAVLSARDRMTSHPDIRSLIKDLGNWPGAVLNSHKSAGQSYHKLSFLADLGIKHDDTGVQSIIDRIFQHVSEEGPIQLPMRISSHHGGSNRDVQAWALCDAPTIVYSLAKMGLRSDERVEKAVDFLVMLSRENGYPCVVSKELGRFRGPGKKEDPCPYATLIMLKLMELYPEYRDSNHAKASASALLDLWENSRTRHPYIFYMGTDFRKLKAPFIWYDILHVAHVLSLNDHALKDPRFHDMVKVITGKADDVGRFTPESVWKAWDHWEIGGKKTPSPYLTMLVYRIKKKVCGPITENK